MPSMFNNMTYKSYHLG